MAPSVFKLSPADYPAASLQLAGILKGLCLNNRGPLANDAIWQEVLDGLAYLAAQGDRRANKFMSEYKAGTFMERFAASLPG